MRQSENNLTALLQRERLTEFPRAYIAKVDIDALAIALNSKNGAAEGVKEELSATFKNNGPGQHAKIAECMRQFAAAAKPAYAPAYEVLRQEVANWTKFDASGQIQPSQRNLFKEIANLHGPGSERVKAETALMIQNIIEEAKSSSVPGSMYELVDSTFAAIADPFGNLAARVGEPGDVQNYRDAIEVYDNLYRKMR